MGEYLEWGKPNDEPAFDHIRSYSACDDLERKANPALLKMKMEPAGHGGASGRHDALKDRAREVASMLQQVGVMKWPASAL